MPQKVKHIFQVPMTGKTPRGDNMSQEWYEKRSKLFIKYTLKSLLNQSVQNFGLWVTFRPEEIFNPTTKKIANAITNSGISNIMSFNGTMFPEDRAYWHNEDLEERLTKCLPQIKELVGDAEYIYETNLDSDDMIHREFSKLVGKKHSKERGALYMQKGFAYNTEHRIADWNNPTSNQNYTIMFPYEVYFDAKKRLKYLGDFDSHEQVPDKFDAEKLPDGMYCTVIHGDNISTIWTHPFRGREYYYEDEKESILKDFMGESKL